MFMERILNYEVHENEEGLTLRDFLRIHGFSHHIFVHMKEYPGSIQVNHQPAFMNRKLKTKEKVTVIFRESASSPNILPVKLPFPILYEDEDILVANKPANMPIHPSMGNYENTLANAAAFYFASKGENFVFRCINRLDRDTTGALILAKHGLSGAILSQMMQKREIHRTYLAVVQGIPPEEGVIDAPIARMEGSTISRQVDWERGEPAVTHYRRLKVLGSHSLIQLQLETGRTHQIRVHMKYLGYPLPGDFLYNPDYEIYSRQPLHSWKLDFVHPITGEPMHLQAPIPEDMMVNSK
jgi:23S rRNA pseudouridine1911/1915/1917 synthase